MTYKEMKATYGAEIIKVIDAAVAEEVAEWCRRFGDPFQPIEEDEFLDQLFEDDIVFNMHGAAAIRFGGRLYRENDIKQLKRYVRDAFEDEIRERQRGAAERDSEALTSAERNR